MCIRELYELPMTELPRIAITVGDPAGVGPEIADKASRNPRVRAVCEPVIYGPADTADTAGNIRPGVLSAVAGRSAYETICRAFDAARGGSVAAMATGPINKEALALAGLPWRGHTELLTHLAGAGRVAMMFYSEPLRVILATVHIPIADVPRALTRERVDEVIDLAVAELPRFGYLTPRLALAGLNPHAGEHGLLGGEEQRVLVPAIAAARHRGINIVGPIPGDTVFTRAVRGEFDAVIACYHDQGLIPVKVVAFGRAVNVTLGLPVIRTSVDHGTAFDIAGRGIADPSSMIEAVLLAARLARARTGEMAGGPGAV